MSRVRHLTVGLVGGLLLALGANSAAGQGKLNLSPSMRAALERLALARARADLVEEVYRLPLTPQRTIGSWVTQSVSDDRALRLWLRSQKRERPLRYYSDGVVEADLSLTPGRLAQQLETLAASRRATDAAALTPTQLRQAVERWPIIWATGAAASTERNDPDKPVGWADVSATGIELARLAAAADATEALLDEAAMLRITNAERLAATFADYPDFRDAVLTALSDQAEVQIELVADQIAEASAAIGLAELVGLLIDAHTTHAPNSPLTPADFREMALRQGGGVLVGHGLAPPPERHRLKRPQIAVDIDPPRWVDDTLTVEHRYEVPIDDLTAERRTLVTAAFAFAVDALRQELEQLPLRPGVSVSEFLTSRRELKDDVVTLLAGTRLRHASVSDNNAVVRVTVALPLRRLWEIAKRGMEPVEVLPDNGLTPAGES